MVGKAVQRCWIEVSWQPGGLEAVREDTVGATVLRDESKGRQLVGLRDPLSDR